MGIRRLRWAKLPFDREDTHFVTYAEIGFSPLSILTRDKLSPRDVQAFADCVNQRNEMGSLHPRLPISAVPRNWIRGPRDDSALESSLREFLILNRSVLLAGTIVVDFGTPEVPEFASDALAAAVAADPDPDFAQIILAVH